MEIGKLQDFIINSEKVWNKYITSDRRIRRMRLGGIIASFSIPIIGFINYPFPTYTPEINHKYEQYQQAYNSLQILEESNNLDISMYFKSEEEIPKSLEKVIESDKNRSEKISQARESVKEEYDRLRKDEDIIKIINNNRGKFLALLSLSILSTFTTLSSFYISKYFMERNENKRDDALKIIYDKMDSK